LSTVTATIDPQIQQEYERNATERRAEESAATGELKTKQQEVAEKVKATEEAFAKIGRALSESKRPEPARRPEDNDISAKAEAYQEIDVEEERPPAPPPPPAPVVRRPVEDEEVASFRWDEDPPAKPATPPRPVEGPPTQQPKPRPRREEEDLSDHDWLE
jgi:hypothetical protein